MKLPNWLCKAPAHLRADRDVVLAAVLQELSAALVTMDQLNVLDEILRNGLHCARARREFSSNMEKPMHASSIWRYPVQQGKAGAIAAPFASANSDFVSHWPPILDTLTCLAQEFPDFQSLLCDDFERSRCCCQVKHRWGRPVLQRVTAKQEARKAATSCRITRVLRPAASLPFDWPP